MDSAYTKYRDAKIDAKKIYALFLDSKRNEECFECLIDAVMPVINKLYKRHSGTYLNNFEFGDIASEVSTDLILSLREQKEFVNDRQFYKYLEKIILNKIYKYLGIYSDVWVDVTDGEEVAKGVATDNHKSVLYKLQSEDLVRLIVQQFKGRNRLTGNYYKASLVVFDKLMKEEDINEKYISVKYNVKGAFVSQYSRVLLRSILYDLHAYEQNEFYDI